MTGRTIDECGREADVLEAVAFGRWPDHAELIAHFKQSRDRNIAYIQTTGDDMRSHFRVHPFMKTIDAYQMMLLLSAHCERHTLQYRDADPTQSAGRDHEHFLAGARGILSATKRSCAAHLSARTGQRKIPRSSCDSNAG